MKRYYFFFRSSDHRVIKRLFRPGFQHCEMITDFGNIVFHVNPRMGRVDYNFTDEHQLHEVISKLRDLGYTAVVYIAPEPDARSFVPRGWGITCASYLAYSIGIPFRGVTPYQLFKTLIARGGEII